MNSWLQSLVQQTLDRKAGVIPTVDDYIVSRRDNSDLKLLFSWIRCEDNCCPFDGVRKCSLTALFSDAYKLDIPDEVMAHPTITAMEDAANDFKTWCNVGFLR